MVFVVSKHPPIRLLVVRTAKNDHAFFSSFSSVPPSALERYSIAQQTTVEIESRLAHNLRPASTVTPGHSGRGHSAFVLFCRISSARGLSFFATRINSVHTNHKLFLFMNICQNPKTGQTWGRGANLKYERPFQQCSAL